MQAITLPLLAIMALTAPAAVTAQTLAENAPVHAQKERIENSGSQDLHQAWFDELDGDEVAHDWDHVAESLHIAFMQQEASRFKSGSQPDLIEAEATADEERVRISNERAFDYSDAEDGREDTNDQDGDGENYDRSSNYDSSSTLGDVRILRDDDDEEEEQEADDEGEVRGRRLPPEPVDEL
jgi:hypothetical protein